MSILHDGKTHCTALLPSNLHPSPFKLGEGESQLGSGEQPQIIQISQMLLEEAESGAIRNRQQLGEAIKQEPSPQSSNLIMGSKRDFRQDALKRVTTICLALHGRGKVEIILGLRDIYITEE